MMKAAGIHRCEICGATHKGDGWFLLSEDQERNTLQILKWNSHLAEHPGVYPLCSAAHVEELVSHWMVSGSLEYEWSQPSHALVPQAGDMDASYQLGELMLDRASFAALGERPDMLNSILDAIDGALQASSATRSLEEEEEQVEEEEAAAAPVYDA
jgi:hypothetical protein